MKIEHRLALDNLGVSAEYDNDPGEQQFVAGYVAALTAQLQADFPDASVEVNTDSDFCNACQTIVSEVSDEYDYQTVLEQVRETANRVWERIC
jgi:hypothetical protein